jgi:hypothetical protein
MTTRHAGYVVTLASDVRDDDAEYIINAIKMVKGVGTVEPIDARSVVPERMAAESRIRAEVSEVLLDAHARLWGRSRTSD